MKKASPSKAQEMLTRRVAVLAYINQHIGKVLPFSRTIAYDTGHTTAQVEHAFRQLSQDGTIVCVGNGNSRVVIVNGVGSTLPRTRAQEVIARKVEPEPVRVFNYSCTQCGARNCALHGPVLLITRPAAVMVLR